MTVYAPIAIPVVPLVAFLILIAGRKIWSKRIAAFIGTTGIFLSLSLSIYVVYVQFAIVKPFTWSIPWFHMGDKLINFSLELENINLLMLLIVTIVSFLVHLFSYDYMKKDERFLTFFAYLSLFTFSMLGLVISANLLQIYIFWELVGVCSFLLIGFWYFKPEAKAAAKKAFIMTRIGDIGLLIAICLLYWGIAETFELGEIRHLISGVGAGDLDLFMLTLVAILIFIAAIGKSGQFPLHSWLPDAMEGPTPISALIHAATMVAAGVFLVAKTFFLFRLSGVALEVVAYVGGFTAIFAATIAVTQYDIKRILAYSTISQLGLMMLGLGCLGYAASIFHLMTHAFFKSLLFLAAGAVIYILHHEQDIRKMGGLWSNSRLLGTFFLVGCLSLAAIPPFSGFFSKDQILLAAYEQGYIVLFVAALVTSFLTAFYMFRLFAYVFMGSAQNNLVTAPPRLMMLSLAVLAILSSGAGLIDTEGYFTSWLLQNQNLVQPYTHSWWISWLATSVALLGMISALFIYGKKRVSESNYERNLFYKLVYNKYYIDELYDLFVIRPLKGISWLFSSFDRWIAAIGVGSAYIFQWIGHVGVRMQNGQAQSYALISLLGLVIMIAGLTLRRYFE